MDNRMLKNIGRWSSPWPSRFAWATFVVCTFLILVGGLITTLRAGMAEDGWLMPEGHWLWLYPWEKRTSSSGRFVEHLHREVATIVGLLSIATVVSALWVKAGKRAVWVALFGLIAVSFQGVVGGTRILDNAPELAFLHGVLAQVVFAILAGVAVLFSRRWREMEDPKAVGLRPMGGLATFTLLALFGQITLGGWYRHGHGHTAIALHGFGAVLVVVLVLKFSNRLQAAGQAAGMSAEGGRVLRRAALWMTAAVHAQWVLGGIALYSLFALSDGMAGENISGAEIVFSTLHVTVGAMLAASVVHGFLWAKRFDGPQPSTAPEPSRAVVSGPHASPAP